MDKKRISIRFIKVCVSAGLIILILQMTDLRKLWHNVTNMNVYLFVLGNFLNFARVFASAYRWKILLSAKDIRVDFGKLSKICFIGIFFNLFLPTALGGDAARAYYLWRFSGEKTEAISSVIIERAIGFFVLGVICLGAIVLSLDEIVGFKQSGLIALLCIVYLIGMLLLFNKQLMQQVFSSMKFLPIKRFIQKIERFYMSLWEFIKRRDVAVKASILSLIYQFAWIVGVMFIGVGIGIDIKPLQYFIFLPIVMVVTMIPVSISGVGVREGAFVIMFGLANVPASSALLLSFLAFSMVIVLGIVGGIVYAISDLRKRTTTPELPKANGYSM